MLGIDDIKRHARNFEDLAPPCNKIELPFGGAAAVVHMRRNSKRNVIGVRLADLHGVVARSTCVRSDDHESASRLPNAFVVFDDIGGPCHVNAVCAHVTGNAHIIDENSDALFLRKRRQLSNDLGLIRRALLRAPQEARVRRRFEFRRPHVARRR